MVKKSQGRKTDTTIELDPQLLIEALQRAGLDLTKLNFREILGPHVDIDALLSNLSPRVNVSINTQVDRK
jgi:hypothetical protein